MAKQYTKQERIFSANYISPDCAALEAQNRPKEENFPDSKFIWAVGCTRFHIFRLFTPKKPVRKLQAAFLSENLFDVWLNGYRVASDVRHMPLTDLTSVLTDGENNLHIRAYQSDSYDRIVSAISGGIIITYADGETEIIPTDESFKQVRLVTFGETKEPTGFETETRGMNVYDLNVSNLHPFAIRRSFYFVKRFEISKQLISAKLFITALGCYEPYLNGKRIGDSYFEPFCINKTSEYQVFDVLSFIADGQNTFGAQLGNGSYNCYSWGSLYWKTAEFLAELELTYSDGSTETILTDESWKCIPSPLVENDIQYGERYDARLEIPGWCENSDIPLNTYGVKARECSDKILLKSYPPIRRMKEHVMSQTICDLGENTPLFDVGVCIAGRAKATFRGLKRGQKIRIRYCERLTDGQPENGAYVTVFYPNDCEKNGHSPGFMRNCDVYTAKGEEVETYDCHFAYTGFRYIWIEGLGDADIISLTAFELYNDLRMTGEIQTNNKAIQKIFDATKRSWLNNLSNGPTDCPTREKNYWNGDSQLFSQTACFLTDNSDFLARWTDNGIKMHAGPYAWEDETYEIPYTLYRFYGDIGILRERYPEMLALIEKRQEFPGMILPIKGISHQYNDWLSPGGVTPDTEFFGGCWYIHMLDRVSEIAAILGDTEKASELAEKAKIARNEFNKKHLEKDNYDAHCQCGIVLPIAFGIAPENMRQRLADRLSDYIKEADYHTTTGFIGARYLFEVLADFGHAEDALKIITNPTAPSWLGMLSSGATAITESWYGESDHDKALSMSHFSLGSIVGWFFEYLGGLRVKESKPGLEEIVLKPVMIKELEHFGVTYDTGHGVIRTEWRYRDGKPEFSYSLPEGVKAHVGSFDVEKNPNR